MTVPAIGGLIVQILLMILATSIVVVVLLQGGKAQGLGSTLTGARDSDLFDTVKESRPEKKASALTFTLIGLFIFLAFLALILLHFQVISF